MEACGPTSPPTVLAGQVREAIRMFTSNLMDQSLHAWKLVVISALPVFFTRGSSRVNPKLASYVEETHIDQLPKPYLNGTSTGSGSTHTVWTPHNPDEFRELNRRNSAIMYQRGWSEPTPWPIVWRRNERDRMQFRT